MLSSNIERDGSLQMAKRGSGKDLSSEMTGWGDETTKPTEEPQDKHPEIHYEEHFKRPDTVTVATRVTVDQRKALEE